MSVEREAELSTSVDDKGTTLRSQLKQIYKSTGIKDPLLEEIEIPMMGRWLYTQFWRLDAKREYGEMSGGPKPLKHEAILAYSQTARPSFKFTHFELLALDQMDLTYLNASYKASKKS